MVEAILWALIACGAIVLIVFSLLMLKLWWETVDCISEAHAKSMSDRTAEIQRRRLDLDLRIARRKSRQGGEQ